jgi:hypothetical protein
MSGIYLIEGVDAASKAFLQTRSWLEARYHALRKYNGVCQSCGRGPKQRVFLNVDHIKNRRDHPELALDLTNLQVLCNRCNAGKGNSDSTDWRMTGVPYGEAKLRFIKIMTAENVPIPAKKSPCELANAYRSHYGLPLFEDNHGAGATYIQSVVSGALPTLRRQLTPEAKLNRRLRRKAKRRLKLATGETIKITPQLIAEGKSSKGGWSRRQLELLGVVWPPQNGWHKIVIGTPIRVGEADEFVRLRDQHIKTRQIASEVPYI